jgi:capsular exopolysaccharide synthesis family protein
MNINPNLSQMPEPYDPPDIVRFEPPPYSLEMEKEEEDSIVLLDYWHVITKRRWIILAVILLVAVITAVTTWSATPSFRATIKIQIDPEQASILPFKEAIDPGSTYAQSQEYLLTQFKVLASNTLADRVIRALDLESNPTFVAEHNLTENKGVFGWLKALSNGSLESLADQKDEQTAARKYSKFTKGFLENLTVTPIRNSRLVEVSFDSRDPRLSADVVNTLADEYINLNFETKFEATKKASEFLERQSTGLKASLEKAEEELVSFGQQHNIFSIGEESKDNVTLHKLADLNTALTAAEADRIQKESVWKIVQAAGPSDYPEVLRSPLIKDLETNVANLSVAKAKLAAAFKRGWPELDQITEQLAEAENQLKVEREKAIHNAETEYRTALKREQLLSKALSDQKIEASALNQNSIQYNIKKRQVDTDKQLYEGLLQRRKEAEVSASLRSSNIHVVDMAEASRLPYKPDKILNMSLALGIGLIFGIGLAFFTEHLDSSIKNPDEIDRYLKLPSLGMIPSHTPLISLRRSRLLPLDISTLESQAASVELVTHQNARAPVSESYRNLRTSILLSSANGRPPKLLVVTSSQQGEGKTTTSINIAITLAQAGGKVILLDGDMRNPELHKALHLNYEKGMSTFLSGNSDLVPVIQKTDIPNLFVVPSGKIPPNPAELIGSPRMKELLELLEQLFDHVVIDTPPVLSVTDARVLATMVDGVILVVKGGQTPRQAVRLTKRLLLEVHAHIIGVLLNDVDVRSADYSYYSKYYCYGYGYGNGNR